MAKSQVINFPTPQHDTAVDGHFLAMIDADISANPHRVRPLSASLLDEIRSLVEEAEACEHQELLQG